MDNKKIKTKLGRIQLTDDQIDALNSLESGSLLVGGVGSGKTYTSIFWAMNQPDFHHLYVITTAANRDMVREGHSKPDWAESLEDCGLNESQYTIDSWQNIQKYKEIHNSIFIFDEQRAVSYGVWGRTFIKIASKNHNRWILTTATPGEDWLDYLCVFIANGFFNNKTHFIKEHVVRNPFVPYFSIQKYINTKILETYRRNIIVFMGDKRKTKRHKNYIYCDYDKLAYNKIIHDRFNEEENRPIETASEFTQLLRKVVNTSPDRINEFKKLLLQNKKVIVFYNYNYELDILKEVLDKDGRKYGEWNGKTHTPIPTGDSWAYLVQYNGAEGWNCIETDTMIFYSLPYSYKKFEQAMGRIDRMNTSFVDLHYYMLSSTSMVDKRIQKALANKRQFAVAAFARKYLN